MDDSPSGEGHLPFLGAEPPPLVARALAAACLALFAFAVLLGVLVEVPETVETPFVLVPVRGADALALPGDPVESAGPVGLRARLVVPEHALARLRPGQTVGLLFAAFPSPRYGVRRGTLRWVSPAAQPREGGAAGSTPGAPATFVAFADLLDRGVRVDGREHPYLPGMTGRAVVHVGRRSLLDFALAPLRQLREAP